MITSASYTSSTAVAGDPAERRRLACRSVDRWITPPARGESNALRDLLEVIVGEPVPAQAQLPGQTVGRKIVGVAGTAAVVYAAWVRPRLMRWGATDEEVTGAYPGAELVPDGQRAATMAVTIDAPPDQVWPWLVQLGGDRGAGTPGTALTTGAGPVPPKSTRSGRTSLSATM
jgi:hypothetical protein